MNKNTMKIDTSNLYDELCIINSIITSIENEYINVRDATMYALDDEDSYIYYKDFEKNIRELIISYRKLNNLVITGVIQKYNYFNYKINDEFNNLKIIADDINNNKNHKG